MPRGSKAVAISLYFSLLTGILGRDRFANNCLHRQTVCSSENISLNSTQKALFRPREAILTTVTRQIVGSYITEFARGAKQGAVDTHSAQKSRQPRTINHRLSVLASYFEYCIRRDTEDGRGPWKGRINPASGNPLTEELRHGMIGRDLPARQRQRDGFPCRSYALEPDTSEGPLPS
jgi:hypothetical protein